MRLNAIAHVRAPNHAGQIKNELPQPGQPRLSLAATTIAARAKAAQKSVWENLRIQPFLIPL